MNNSLSMRSATAVAAAAALSLLLAAGPGGGRGPRMQDNQSGQGQGGQQCPPAQNQSQATHNQSGPNQTSANVQLSLMDQGTLGANDQTPGPNDQGPGGGQGPTGGRQGPQRQVQSLSGTVSSYNLNPSGTPESMMLNTGNATVQLNFPPEMASSVQSAAAVGSHVSVTARSGGPGGGGPGGPDNRGGPGGPGGPDDQQQADHKVMNLESIKTAAGQSLSIAGPASGQNAQVEGAVKTLNYDRRGEVNGAQLDNGDFVHLRPGSDANLTVGEKVTVEGRERTAKSGIKIIEAESINGAAVNDNGPGGNGGPGNNGGPAGGPPGGNGGGGAPGQ